jgi:hypothetical protein
MTMRIPEYSTLRPVISVMAAPNEVQASTYFLSVQLEDYCASALFHHLETPFKSNP